jgi:prepilin-type N-terminal cleavage/methylation domain-containing protein
MQQRRGFTLLEMLISTVLLSLVLLGLYGAMNMQQRSTRHLRTYLDKAMSADRGVMVLYRDLFQSNGQLTIQNGEFDRLCIDGTSHSLHGLAQAKVCWVVAKEGRTLLRIEGNDYRLPLSSNDGVEVDEVMKPMELFDIQWDKKKGRVLVALQTVAKDPFVFLIQGLTPPPKPVKKPPKKPGSKTKPKKPKSNTTKDGKPPPPQDGEPPSKPKTSP